jgi:hypothetical protein
MPGWHREPEHIGEIARITIGDRTGQPQDLGIEDPLGRDHLLQVGQLACVVGRLGTGQHEPADLLPGEPHLDPDARLRRLVVSRGDQIVEGPVEMRERHVDTHPRDG